MLSRPTLHMRLFQQITTAQCRAFLGEKSVIQTVIALIAPIRTNSFWVLAFYILEMLSESTSRADAKTFPPPLGCFNHNSIHRAILQGKLSLASKIAACISLSTVACLIWLHRLRGDATESWLLCSINCKMIERFWDPDKQYKTYLWLLCWLSSCGDEATAARIRCKSTVESLPPLKLNAIPLALQGEGL